MTLRAGARWPRNRPPTPAAPARALAGVLAAVATVVVLAPGRDRASARRQIQARIDEVARTWRPRMVAPWRREMLESLPLSARVRSPLASWASVGGCGAGGSSASGPGGGIKWVGRNVTGGMVDVQTLTSYTSANGNGFTTITSRVGMRPARDWGLALYLPIVHKAGEVTVLGSTKTARLAGFGDLSLEVSRKLGAVGAHELSLIASVPTGSSDAVRQGVVLPQHLQLGSGVPGLSAQYQHTRDRDWGLTILGGALSYGGWENGIGDWRAPSATAFAHAGYVVGPLVPSAGLTLFAKPAHDRERGAPRPSHLDPLFLLVPSVGLEWSTDWIAVLPAATLGLSPAGFESVSVGVGISSSLF